ncbi:alpha/beta hydrolase [Amycolatopsis acidiphila]|uniref:Alpha/beta hydrolase n=1 Tax=Amycolatopsis acidiphila TaxID=715473 RepID=A0A558A0T2_9PSEU|nr:alpha/beta hydrolase [Amycolatopsis acidiphila]TVT17854.1 alpha/beta hydrolase [Amycolatopsis acidiphila]UIJ62246.1 alpha/beta hydrolase [Amycolatopsis acidiphila]GHG92854.1 alpha/beta hydrolase [Amycolatopsis acidiphila]
MADYATVNGLKMYYEVHGEGRPVVLLHGGVLTLELSFGPMLPQLATGRQVIGVELQGHGHTADIDREVTLGGLAGDVVALLDELGLERADLFGFSLGGLVALELATAHPGRVDRLVLASTHYRPDGYHADIHDPALQAASTRMPTEADFAEMFQAYQRVAPEPERFDSFKAKVSEAVARLEGWSADQLRAVTAPTLLIVGDNDFVRLEHAIEMAGLIPDAQLAVLPGTTHSNVLRRTGLVLPMVESFLR